MKSKLKGWFIELFILFIITVPAFLTLLNSQYFSMHDDQHIARLYLLFEGIKQGQLFPRWVDMLGFGFGYPLFNFYPPLIYYIAAGFHVAGFSLIWSIKLMIITGFITAALGIYLLIKQIIGKRPAFLGAVIYTYFFYHSITVYVRGALAEFFSMSILPFVFLGIYKIYEKPSIKSILFFAISFALLILTHPLIAFPSLIYIGLFSFFLFLLTKNKIKFIELLAIGLFVGLSLSSFYWLPSMIERKYTLTDQILTTELANYKDHYVYPQQLWYSPWGFGGSVKGLGDGFTFQLGKIPIMLVILSVMFAMFFLYKNKKINEIFILYSLFIFLLLFSLFMTTFYSSFIWDNIKYLWYMQFPWRMLTFSALFISICCAFGAYFAIKLLITNYGLRITNAIIVLLIFIVVIKYSPYFRPQQLIRTTDAERTTFEEIVWKVSSTSYEFVPKGVETIKTKFKTTTLAISRNQLPINPYEILSGKAKVNINQNIYSRKEFFVNAKTSTIFRLNTYYFPGWRAYINGKEVHISDSNRLKLITIQIPTGKNLIQFRFENTNIRNVGNIISIISFLGLANMFGFVFIRYKSKDVKK